MGHLVGVRGYIAYPWRMAGKQSGEGGRETDAGGKSIQAEGTATAEAWHVLEQQRQCGWSRVSEGEE